MAQRSGPFGLASSLALPLALAASLAGCVAPRPLPEPEVLTTPSSLRGDFLVRQRIQGTFGAREFSFEAALQKRGDTLTVVGLTPYGTRAFVLVQRGRELEFTSYLPEDRAPPLAPRFLLQDIHHALFLSVEEDPDRVLDDGDHTLQIFVADDGEELIERWEDGRVARRTFRKLSGWPEGDVVVTYEGGLVGVVPPRRIRLDNGYYGYRLTVETLEHRWLD